MNKGEVNLRVELTDALIKSGNAALIPSVDTLVEAVSSLELFVHMGKIHWLMEADWLDYGDGWRSYTAYVGTDEDEDI